MSLQKELEDLKEQEAAAIEAEAKETEKEIEAEDEPEKVDEPAKEAPKPEPKVEEKTTEEEKPDESSYGRLRREKAAEKRRADALAEENTRLKEQLTAPKAEESAEYEDNKVELPPVVQEMVHERIRNNAIKELSVFEDKFKTETPDFEDISRQYNIALGQSIRIQNPDLTMDEVVELIKEKNLKDASAYFNQGLNPAEELYHRAKKLGFKALPKEEPKVEEQEDEDDEPKVDLDKLAKNKQRNAGMAGANGRGAGGQLTLRAAADYTPQEWVKLPRSEKDRILRGG